MPPARLDSDERRKTIVAAAVPLFARKGFAGTTTRELAEAAGISEALLFRHFPSKLHLYREILRLGCEGDPALERLTHLPPCTETLASIVRMMVRHFVIGDARERAERDARLRLFLHSCLEDGEFAREVFGTITDRVVPLFAASIEAAAAACDLVPGPAKPANAFWFAHHVAATMAFAALPAGGQAPYEGTPEQLVEEASNFILRGIGMTETAIAATAESAVGETAAGALKAAAD